MKSIAYLTAGVMLAAVATTSSAGVSVSIGEPGFFGAINIGNAPQPVLMNQQPVIIQRAQGPVEPLYLRVRPNEQKNWKRNCGRYNACNRPVYFVDHNWYQNSYAPYYSKHRQEYERHDNRRDDHHDNGRNNHNNGHR
jgi:hypothetical protein